MQEWALSTDITTACKWARCKSEPQVQISLLPVSGPDARVSPKYRYHYCPVSGPDARVSPKYRYHYCLSVGQMQEWALSTDITTACQWARCKSEPQVQISLLPVSVPDARVSPKYRYHYCLSVGQMQEWAPSTDITTACQWARCKSEL